MAFTTKNLLEAGQRYHTSPFNAKKRDANSDEAYREHVLDGDRTAFVERLEGIIIVLRRWQAVRGVKGGGDEFRKRVKPWLAEHEHNLRRLQGKPLAALGRKELELVFVLTASLRELPLPATTYGKFLHFLLPETVLLWDQAWVRDGYGLGSDPYSFLAYQCFGQRLLEHLGAGGRGDEVKALPVKHEPVAHRLETLPKLIDELAYHEELRSKAEKALGGRLQAFSIEDRFADLLQ